MGQQYSFRFVDQDLNRQLLTLLNESKVPHTLDAEGTIMYSAKYEDVVGSELIPRVRDRQFASWQVLSCPSDWLDRYKLYMNRNHVPFKEEIVDGEVSFLIPGNYRPHSWQLDHEVTHESPSRSAAEAVE